MHGSTRALMLTAFALIGACEAKVGEAREEPGQGAATNDASATAGKAEEGQLSIKVPGFDLKLDIPRNVASHANAEGQLIYPGAQLSGMHLEAGAEQNGAPKSGVGFRFRSSDPPDKVAGWYRDPARADGFAVASARREGDGFTIRGTQRPDGGPFTLRLTSAAGGTEGRLTLAERN